MRVFLFVLRLLAVVLPACLVLPASAQNYPNRTVRLIVPFGAGGPADVYARVLAQYLSEETKQSFVVEDKPGAGSLIGTDLVLDDQRRQPTPISAARATCACESMASSGPIASHPWHSSTGR